VHVFALVLFLAYQSSDPPAPAVASSATTPFATSMEPKAVKPGSLVVVNGGLLDADQVDQVFLTDHRQDVQVQVVQQKANVIQFKIPNTLKPGRQQLLLLTKGQKPVLLELPFYVQVDEDEAREVARK
jgi:hypothetical protein